MPTLPEKDYHYLSRTMTPVEVPGAPPHWTSLAVMPNHKFGAFFPAARRVVAIAAKQVEGWRT